MTGRYSAIVVTGARPNFVKLAPVVHGLRDRGVDVSIVHTGQHYDAQLSDVFVQALGLPSVARDLEAGSGTHAEQTAAVMVAVERTLVELQPDALVVAGDVNSTLAAALAAVKLGLPVVHVESGLRSHDWTMPEEINRVVCDRISDLLLCHSAEAVSNLAAEGIGGARVALVGNTMIDSLVALRDRAEAAAAREHPELAPRDYALVTLHRPAVVDDRTALASVVAILADLADRLPVVFPLHPRTRARVHDDPPPGLDRLTLLGPLDYLEFLGLQARARLVVTDSGGIQEEAAALGVPCLTYRDTTERPVTVEAGTNRVVGIDPDALARALKEELAAEPDFAAAAIPLWDGRAGERAADAIVAMLAGQGPTPLARMVPAPPAPGDAVPTH